jgi:hypothetical protein
MADGLCWRRPVRRWIVDVLVVQWVLASVVGLAFYPLTRAAFGVGAEVAWTVAEIVWAACLVGAVISLAIAHVRLERRGVPRDRRGGTPSPAVLVIVQLISTGLIIAGVFVIGSRRPLEGVAAIAFGAMGVTLCALRWRDLP